MSETVTVHATPSDRTQSFHIGSGFDLIDVEAAEAARLQQQEEKSVYKLRLKETLLLNCNNKKRRKNDYSFFSRIVL